MTSRGVGLKSIATLVTNLDRCYVEVALAELA